MVLTKKTNEVPVSPLAYTKKLRMKKKDEKRKIWDVFYCNNSVTQIT